MDQTNFNQVHELKQYLIELKEILSECFMVI